MQLYEKGYRLVWLLSFSSPSLSLLDTSSIHILMKYISLPVKGSVCYRCLVMILLSVKSLIQSRDRTAHLSFMFLLFVVNESFRFASGPTFIVDTFYVFFLVNQKFDFLSDPLLSSLESS